MTELGLIMAELRLIEEILTELGLNHGATLKVLYEQLHVSEVSARRVLHFLTPF